MDTSAGECLEKSCPSCKGDLNLRRMKRWFTLYFIPVLPLKTLETFYKCKECSKTYKEEIKEMLEKGQTEFKDKASKIIATTLAACMTHMAKIDGNICKEELKEINKIKTKFPQYKKEIEKVISDVKKSKNDEYVFNILRNARTILTMDGIAMLIGQVARVLLADGKIDKKEEKLMKEYLLVCGIPREMYDQIISQVKKSM